MQPCLQRLELGVTQRFCCTSWLRASDAGLLQGHTAGGSCRHGAPSETNGASAQRDHGSLQACHF